MVEFEKRVLLLGCGAVGHCALPLLLRHLKVAPAQVTVIDFQDRRPAIQEWLAQGVTFLQERVTPENLGTLLGRRLGPGDLLVDLAWNIDACEILRWCHAHGVLYLNTSVEVWDPYAIGPKHPTERTLYWRHMNIRRMTAGWSSPGPTAVLEHGANPGLISHWTKQGLLDIAARLLGERKVQGAEAEELRHLAQARTFNRLAMKLGVKVIHCSERDTQISDRPKQVDEFVNTWSIEGFREEGTTTAEMGWGTHERTMPELAFQHPDGPRNQICLARMGINVRVRSWVPDYAIQGMVVRHGEAFTLSDRLTVCEDGKPVYRPTVHYAYCPCDNAIISLHELRGRDYALQPSLRIMTDEITSGADILGALIMGHAYGSWWTGSHLTIEQSRDLVPHQNATTLQVASSVAAAACWIVRNPDRGVLVPDDLPHEFVLDIARPYLGHNLSVPSDWTPLKGRTRVFEGHARPDLDLADPWQFKNFLVTDSGD
ncbi:MAG: saccharopine dehydrogenase C-terminal domain-containing protein [Holophaga sp.]|jgi:homospermidine synthase